jgi:gas vesicle protein
MPQHDNDEVVYVREERTPGLAWFVAGAVIGAGVALLFAPQSGAETRRQLKRKARHLRQVAEDGLEDLGERFEEGKERLRETVREGAHRVRERVQDVRERAEETVEGVRSAGHTAREELENRLSEARSRRRTAAVADDEGTTA